MSKSVLCMNSKLFLTKMEIPPPLNLQTTCSYECLIKWAGVNPLKQH